MVIVLMGPAGAGKSTVGVALSEQLGWSFVDADEYHTPDNKARMERGTPLSEAERVEWLTAVRAVLARALERRDPLVLACSVLAARHRAQLADGLRSIRFVYLKTAPAILRARLESRKAHFAKATLLDSQLATLEEPGPEALTVDGAADVATIVGRIRLEFGA
jgi:gluconokinase